MLCCSCSCVIATHQVYVDKKFVCPAKLSKANWLGSDTYGDTFSIVADKVHTHELPPPLCIP